MYSFSLALLSILTTATARYTLTLPSTSILGPVTADFTTPSLDQSDLDAPKLDRINSTVFDWWYFDAVAANNGNASVAITFTSAGLAGLPPISSGPSAPNGTYGGNGTDVLTAHVWVTFPDGRTMSRVAGVSSARVSGSGDTSMGSWSGGGGWVGSEEGYEVSIEMGTAVRGRVSMEKITSPHSHCSTAPTQGGGGGFNNSLELGPLGWVSILPDAMAVVDLEVEGVRLQFEGYGYHDKNWSNKPLMSNVKSLTRGHAHLGLYSVMWVSYQQPTNESPIVTGYVARDGETLSAGCAAGSVGMRAVTAETEGGMVSGYEVTMPGARMQVATDTKIDVDGVGGHMRYNGRARGVIQDTEEDGVAIWETFTF